MDLLKALFWIAAVWTGFVIIPELILAYLKKSTDKEIDDFCRRMHERIKERRGDDVD